MSQCDIPWAGREELPASGGVTGWNVNGKLDLSLCQEDVVS